MIWDFQPIQLHIQDILKLYSMYNVWINRIVWLLVNMFMMFRPFSATLVDWLRCKGSSSSSLHSRNTNCIFFYENNEFATVLPSGKRKILQRGQFEYLYYFGDVGGLFHMLLVLINCSLWINYLKGIGIDMCTGR